MKQLILRPSSIYNEREIRLYISAIEATLSVFFVNKSEFFKWECLGDDSFSVFAIESLANKIKSELGELTVVSVN